MSHPDKVVWHESMMLSPQHMQYFGKYIEFYDDWICKIYFPYCYGLSELLIDTDALSSGQFVVEVCRGLFQSGEKIDIDQSDQLCCRLEKSCSVYLSLSSEDAISGLAHYKSRGDFPREVSYEQVLPDIYDQSRKSTVALAKLNYYLTFEPTAEKYCLKLADIIKNSQNDYVIDSTFIPSCLNIFATKACQSYINSIFSFLKRKRRAILNHAFVLDAYYLGLMNQCLVKIEYMLYAKKSHPWHAYQVLFNLLSGFKYTQDRLAKIHYDHDQLYTTFSKLFGDIQKAIEYMMPHQYKLHQFTKIDETQLILDQLETTSFINTDWYLRVRFNQQDLSSVFQSQVKISSAKDAKHLMSASLPGLGFEKCSKLPKEFKLEKNTVFYQVHQSGKYWESIMQDKMLSITLTQALSGCEIDLLIRGQYD